MSKDSQTAFTDTCCAINNYEGDPIIATHYLNGANVVKSIGVFDDGHVVEIDKITGEVTRHPPHDKEGKECRAAVKGEWTKFGGDIPAEFMLALTI